MLPKSNRALQEDDPAGLPLEAIERRHILRILEASGGNKTLAAKTLDIDYKTLLSKLKKFGVDN
jgi:transcriptional regulator with PAS, ATPase and Fis domain